MGLCKCNNTLGNTGTPGCVPLIGVTSGLIKMFTYASDGTKNRITAAELAEGIDNDYITAKLNHADPTKRWYPVQNFQDIEGERAESIFKEYASGFRAKIKQGVRNFIGTIPFGTPSFLKKLEKMSCEQISFFIIDNNAALVGKGNGAGDLLPYEVQKGSFEPRHIMATEDSPAEILVNFNWGLFEKDSDMEMLPASAIEGVNLLSIKGLIDVYGVASEVSTTGFALKLFTDYGAVGNKIVVKGLVSENFTDGVTPEKIKNVTGDASVDIISVTESPEGTYTFIFDAQTAEDILKVVPVKNGFDFSSVAALNIAIPA